MSTSQQKKPEGLRARKRRATENSIETAAVELALSNGVKHVTIDEICERADISRSTFFNYFSGRDYAILGRAVDIPEGADAFSVLESCPDNLPLGIFRLVFAAIGHRYVNTDVARLRAQLVAEQPEAVRMSLVTLLESAYQVTGIAVAWLEANPQHQKLDSPMREVVLAQSLAHGVIMGQMSEWMTGSGDVEADFCRAIDDYRKLVN